MLERVGDARFDIFGTGAGPTGRDGNGIELKTGEKLNIEFGEGYNPSEDHHNHQQVGCDFMIGK